MLHLCRWGCASTQEIWTLFFKQPFPPFSPWNFGSLLYVCVCVCTSPWPDHKLESRSPASTLPIRARLISWCLGTAPILLAHGGTVTTPSQQKKPGLSGARTSACHTLKLAAQCLKQLSYRSGVTVTHFKLSTNSSKLQKLQDSQSSNSF